MQALVQNYEEDINKKKVITSNSSSKFGFIFHMKNQKLLLWYSVLQEEDMDCTMSFDE